MPPVTEAPICPDLPYPSVVGAAAVGPVGSSRVHRVVYLATGEGSLQGGCEPAPVVRSGSLVFLRDRDLQWVAGRPGAIISVTVPATEWRVVVGFLGITDLMRPLLDADQPPMKEIDLEQRRNLISDLEHIRNAPGERTRFALVGLLSTWLAPLALQVAERSSLPIWVHNLVQTIDADPTAAYTSTDLLRMTGVTNAQLLRAFRRHLSCTPSDFLMRRRLSVAEDLLRTTDKPVHEVARRAGFENPNRFEKAFRAVHGVRPAKWLETAIRA